MTPVIKKEAPRTFAVALERHVVKITADTISEPGLRTKEYAFELDGEVVGRFKPAAVHGWWLETADWPPAPVNRAQARPGSEFGRFPRNRENSTA